MRQPQQLGLPHLLQLVLIAGAASAASNWTAASDGVIVSVDTASFSYSVAVGGMGWLSDGRVAVQCGGARYCSECGNLTGGPVTVINGTAPALGAFSAIQRIWTAGSCTALTTSIRQYASSGAIDFVTEVSAQGARGTMTAGPGGSPAALANHPVTEFPSLALINVLPPPPPPPPPPRISPFKLPLFRATFPQNTGDFW